VKAGTTYSLQINGSGSFSLNVDVQSPPANDDIANAQVIPPFAATRAIDVFGNNRGASFETGEVPPPCGQQPSGSVWYRYTAEATGLMAVGGAYQPGQDVYRPTVAVYTGPSGPTAPQGCFNWDYPYEEAALYAPYFPVVAGQTYWFQITADRLQAGSFGFGLYKE